MKLSDFLSVKKVKFINGKVEVVSTIINGDFELYNLNIEKLKEIKTEIIDKMDSDIKEEKFIYELIPYISNIEKDITFEQFAKLVESSSVEFTYVLEGLIDVVNNIFELADRNNEISNKVSAMKDKRPELFVQPETIEEKILRFTKELEEEKDIKRKKTLLKELSKLYEEVDK